MQEVSTHFQDDADVGIVSIQTAFEGFGINNFDALAAIAKRYSLDIPLGHNGSQNAPSPLLFSYQARGTPWLVIIDKTGAVRWSGFFQKPVQSIELINQLKSE